MDTCPTCEVSEREAHALALASQELLHSLGEYIRQSMHMNPEWRSGITMVEQALWQRRFRTGKIDQ
jgi:hypothetical protein